METLFNELEEYLSSNTIQYTSDRENYTVSFDGKTYEFFPPNDDGYFFDEDFRWDNETTEYDGYVFRFGGVWYTIEKGQERDPKLNRVKWRGQSEVAGLSSNFLGVHGSFELLNGTSLYSDWVKKSKFLGIERLGIVEKGTLAGALKFQNACKSVGIIPVFGLEVPVKDEKKDISFTYKIYAQNEKGWQHLLAINKIINCDSSGKFITPKDISEHTEDVFIVFDPKTIDYTDVPILLRNKHNVFWQADTVEYAKFNRDTEYLTNFEAFYKSKMKPVALCDAFYIEPEYYILRETVNKIGKKVNHKSYNQYFKDEVTYMEELLSLFGDQSIGEAFYLKARENMDMIAESCNFEIPTDSRHLPRYEMTKEEKEKYESNEDMFDFLIYEGIENKPELLEDYSEDVLVERIERESSIIKFGGVIDYFLVLRDIVNWCKENNILLGAGRGSASGSLISYLFGIINTHPLKFNLLFERFLTKGRLGHFEKQEVYEVTLEDGTKKILPINVTTKNLKVGDDILV
nr:MAG TPA: DNA polymerase III, alpha subunit [Caudoviricetes sp.]